MTAKKLGPFSGMNSKLNDKMLPTEPRTGSNGLVLPKLRNAVNVAFDFSGMAHFPAIGKTKVYSGTNCHSLYDQVPLFVDNGTLKYLNPDYTATSLRSNIGDTPMYYCTVANLTYFCNQIITGKFDNDTKSVSEWGVDRPTRQPNCVASSIGGMYAGDYRVAIVWYGSDGITQSGTGMGRRVTVQEGGGINCSGFPTPPSYVTAVGVYVSSINGKDMYWYYDYPPNVDDVHIQRLTPEGVEPTLTLETQFCYPPKPQGILADFNGRIYYAVGNQLYYTTTRNYNLRRANERWAFEGQVLEINSVPPVLYVHTDRSLNQITGVDNGDQPPQFRPIGYYSCTPGLPVYGKTDTSAYSFSDVGFLQCNNDGSVNQLSFADNALPSFKQGVLTVLERYGSRYLVFVGTDATQNKLADAQYNTNELARNSL